MGAPACCQGVAETVLEVLRRGAFDRQAHPHAAGKRQELIGAQTLGEPPVTRQYGGQQDVGVEIGRRQQPQFGEHGGLHLLCLIDHQNRPAQSALDMRLPALAQDLGTAVAVGR